MKKILFLVPLMAVSLMTNCGDKATTYNITIGKTDHLSFTTLDGKSLTEAHPKKNKDFKFKMKAVDEGSATFQVPSTLNINVEGAGEIFKGYTINPNKDYDEAEVIIEANKVIGNITISGQAVPINNYRYEFKASYGIKSIESKVVSKNQALKLELEAIEKEEGGNDKYELPKDENIYIQFDNCPVGDKVQWVSPAEELKQYCEYKIESGKGILTIQPNYIKSNIIIVVRAFDYPLLDKLSWEEIHKVSFSGTAEYVFYLGEEKNVVVNNQPHKVHIIGFDEDYTNLKDKEHTAIGITFEFINAICDENGYSLATYWNDTSDTTKANHNYKDSSVRKALTKEGKADLNWFRYYGSSEDAGKNKYFVSSKDTAYYQKSVLDMLPEDLTKFLVTPSKYINIYEGSSWQEATVEDKLFLLSPVEVGRTSHDHEEADTSTYSYYLGAEQDLTTRIKHQIKGETEARFEPLSGTDLSGQYTLLAKHSYAGYDGEDDTSKERGTYLWFRSPETGYDYYSYLNDRLGRVTNFYDYYPYRDALNLAPAFCI